MSFFFYTSNIFAYLLDLFLIILNNAKEKPSPLNPSRAVIGDVTTWPPKGEFSHFPLDRRRELTNPCLFSISLFIFKVSSNDALKYGKF